MNSILTLNENSWDEYKLVKKRFEMDMNRME